MASGTDDRFVSEREIEADKQKRQEEWEKVRNPDEPLEVPEPEVDYRPLYERLKEQQEKKDAEHEEAHAIKNSIRGLDEEEVKFLEFVDTVKEREEDAKKSEEREVLAEYRKAVLEGAATSSAPTDVATTSVTETSTTASTFSRKRGVQLSAQAQLLSGAVKLKSNVSPTEMDKKKSKFENGATSAPCSANPVPAVAPSNSVTGSTAHSTNSTPCTRTMVTVGIRPSAMQVIGVLPGLQPYGGDGDESDSTDDGSSDSSSDFEGVMGNYGTAIQVKRDEGGRGEQGQQGGCQKSAAKR